MGKLTDQAIESMKGYAEYAMGEVMFAQVLDRALEAGGIELKEGVWISAYSPVLTLTLSTEELQTDRTYMTAIRRALGIPHMERTFNEVMGQFRFSGKSTSLFHKERPVELNFVAGANGCKLERIVETKEVVRFVANCTEAAEEAAS